MKKLSFLIIVLFFSAGIFAQSDSLHYRIILKFGSIGTGVSDSKPVLDYISSFKKKNKLKSIAYDRIGPMGREGEFYMAFPLKELSKKQQADFVKNVKQIAEKKAARGYVNAEENESLSKEEYDKKITHRKL